MWFDAFILKYFGHQGGRLLEVVFFSSCIYVLNSSLGKTDTALSRLFVVLLEMALIVSGFRERKFMFHVLFLGVKLTAVVFLESFQYFWCKIRPNWRICNP